MIARQSVWSDAEVQQLAAEFVPAADEVWFLQRHAGPECAMFRQIAEQGHYAGRGSPSDTRQGIYMCTPSGAFLASLNHNDPRRVAKVLRAALEKWRAMPADQRLAATAPERAPADRWRLEQFYPEGGLVLRVNQRDLPRESIAAGWRGHAWNQDYAWFRKAEAEGFVPEARLGATRAVPENLVKRLAVCHLTDTVRGQAPAFPPDAVERATLTSTVLRVDGTLIGLRLAGDVRVCHRGKWRIEGLKATGATDQERGFEGRMLGVAVWDTEAGRFRAFDSVVLGRRWGACQYNCRADDAAPAAMGVSFTLAGDSPQERIAPAGLWGYGWKLGSAPRAK